MWNKVNVGFNVEEETANFGTRACAVNDVAVYETNTLAEIHAGEKPTHLPKVDSHFIQQVGLFIAIDSSLTIFSEDCSSVKSVITFEHDIQAYTVTPCGLFVLVGVNGQLKCFPIQRQGHEVFTRTVFPPSDYVNFNSIYCYEEDSQVIIIVVLTNGKVLRSTPINFKNLYKAISCNDNSIYEITTQDVFLNEIFHLKGQKSQVNLRQNTLKDRDSIILGSAQELCLLNIKEVNGDTSVISDSYKIINIGGVLNNSVLFALCDGGHILQVCMHTLVSKFVWTNYPVKNFIVIEGSSTFDSSLLLLIDEPLQGQAIVLMSWPDYEIKYKIPVSDSSFLIHQKGAEDVLFLEGFGKEEIDTIRVKAVIESHPELRLERILRRCKFEEAEQFAKTFSLDLDMVYKAHVQKLCGDLDPWNPPKDNPKTIFNKILELIKKIKDNHFVAEICVSATPPDFSMLHTMLMYGMERFSKVTDKSCGNLSELLAKVSMVARRLDTCMLIHGTATTVNHWIQFPKYDLVINCLNHLKKGEIKESILIWSRHLSDIEPILNVEKAILLLEGISKTTPDQDLMLWLHHFVPPILALYPSILSNVVEWTIQRGRGPDLVDNKTWPNSGLCLAKCLLHLVHTPHMEKSVVLQSCKVNHWNERLSHQSPVTELIEFIDNLQDIKTLKETYSVNISYYQFIQEDYDSFVFALLENLPPEKIDLFMADFYHRLMSERELDPDGQILRFVQDIVMNHEGWWFWDEAPWEGRVLALIPHITNIEVKLDAILYVLKSASVPWTSEVSQLADKGMQLPHIKSKDIRNECKEVPKRLILKKYNILLEGNFCMQLVQLILKRGKESMLDDINVLIKCFDIDVTNIYLKVIINLLNTGKEHMVSEVLQTVNEECQSKCISQLLLYVTRMIDFHAWDKVSRFLNAMPGLKDPIAINMFTELKSIYCLVVEFDILTTYSKLCEPSQKQSILDSYADRTANSLLLETCTMSVAVKQISRLAHLLSLTAEEGIISLAKFSVKHSLSQALSALSNIGDLEMKPDRVYKKLSDLVGLLIAFYNPAESDNSLIELFSSVVQRLSKGFFAFSCDGYMDKTFGWVSLFPFNRGASKSSLGLYRNPPYNTTTAIMVHTCAKNIIFSHIRSVGGLFPKELVNASLATSPEITTEVRDVLAVCQRLKEEQQDLSCIKLVYEYYWSKKIVNSNFKEDPLMNNFLTYCIKDLLRKLFRLRIFDVELALSLLHFFGRDEAINFLVEEAQRVGFNYQPLGSISQLALTYSSVNKIEKYTKSFRKHHISCKWAKKLNELGLPYKDAFKDTDSEHKQLVLKLITLPSTTVSMLKEFCLDMYFDPQECFMIYLEYLLLHWEPDLEIKISPSGEKEMVVKNSSDELLQQCKVILHQLRSPSGRTFTWSESIQNELCNLWNKVNCYYYEVYFVLSNLYQQVLSQEAVLKQISSYQSVLQFLQTYRRISSPSETEQEQWFQLFPNKNNLPQISNFRLPFLPFFVKDSPWGILKPELSLKTYKTWFNIIPQLGLDRDMLCTLTIQRLSSDQLAGGSKDKSLWRLQTCNSSVLQEIQECVKNIHNQEMASAALYYVVNHIPPGADQMAAATLCYMQAEQWIQQDKSEKARAGFAKVQKKYLTVCTSHILHSSGLARQEYLQLVLHPEELILALYNDPSIVQRKTGNLSHCPDINRVVLAIGRLHSVNVLGIQQELLSEWLNPPDQPPLDMSCEDVTQHLIMANTNPMATSDNHSIIRACYVLESMEMETAARYLVSYTGLRDDVECRSTSVRLRALQCLCSIATADIVVNVTGSNLDTIKKNMHHLMFISELEKLGLAWSTTSFENCDKEDVVRILLSKQTPHAVELAAAMGHVFKLTNIQYWDKILHLLTSFSMVEELTTLLPKLTSLSHLLDHNIFTRAWNCALITPFLKAEKPLSEETRHRLQCCLEMLYCCPVPRQLDLTLLQQKCEQLCCTDWVARLQPFLGLHQSQSTYIKQEPSF